MKLLLFILGTASLIPAIVRAEPPKELNFASPGGARWTVTADGLSAIHIGDRPIAAGGWRLEGGHKWFAVKSEDLAAAPITQKEIEIVSDHVARVRHVQGQLTILYTYTFDGEDLRIKAWLENHHDLASIEIEHFTGLTMDFGQVPTGWMPLVHSSVLQRQPDAMWHPSAVRIGASWGIGNGFGLGCSPGEAFTEPTLVMWEWEWGGKQQNDPQRLLRYFVKAVVAPQTARTFTLTMRCSRNTDWKNLVAPYKEIYEQRFGKSPAYAKADGRLLMQSVLNNDAFKPDNPYGIHVGRRIDTTEGLAEYSDNVIKGLENANGGGVILWAQGGGEKRGAMYRPDFDILPPEIAANLPKLTDRLQSHGFKLGVTARPGDVAERATWKEDWAIPLAPTAFNIGFLSLRFANMTKLGTSMFYLDSFGNNIDHTTIMAGVRQKLGRSVPTYPEQGSDVIIPYSGLYTELGWDNNKHQYVFAWLRPEDIEFLRWLCPDLPICAKVRPMKRFEKGPSEGAELELSDDGARVKKDAKSPTADAHEPDLLDDSGPRLKKVFEAPAADVDEPVVFLFKHHITPLFEDGFFWNDTEEFKQFGKLSKKYLDGSGQWIEQPSN